MVYGCDTARSAVASWLASPLPAPAESSLKDLQVQLSRGYGSLRAQQPQAALSLPRPVLSAARTRAANAMHLQGPSNNSVHALICRGQARAWRVQQDLSCRVVSWHPRTLPAEDGDRP